jgi:hypothetical protein
MLKFWYIIFQCARSNLPQVLFLHCSANKRCRWIILVLRYAEVQVSFDTLGVLNSSQATDDRPSRTRDAGTRDCCPSATSVEQPKGPPETGGP